MGLIKLASVIINGQTVEGADESFALRLVLRPHELPDLLPVRALQLMQRLYLGRIYQLSQVLHVVGLQEVVYLGFLLGEHVGPRQGTLLGPYHLFDLLELFLVLIVLSVREPPCYVNL